MNMTSRKATTEIAETAETNISRNLISRVTLRTLRPLRLIFVAAVVSGFSRTAVAQTPQQAVIDTAAGTVVIDLASDGAPSQVAYFIQTAQQGGYDGTTFHR